MRYKLFCDLLPLPVGNGSRNMKPSEVRDAKRMNFRHVKCAHVVTAIYTLTQTDP